MRELNLLSPGTMAWLDRRDPELEREDDVIVRPFVAARCDADSIPTTPALLRLVRLAMKAKLLDPIVRDGVGPTPFAAPCALGHECVAEVIEVGAAVTAVAVGDKVVVPWSISCGQCAPCRRGLTTKCVVSRSESGRERPVACYGNGPVAGGYGGMVSDLVRVPYGNHMPARLPDGLDPLRVAAASDNLTDGWRCVAPFLRYRPEASVLVVGGLAKSVGLYAAGIAAAFGARVDYLDSNPRRLAIAESLGARPTQRPGLLRFPRERGEYDLVVDASNLTNGLTYAVRSTAPGGDCVVPSYHLGAFTPVPLMHMSWTDITLHVGPSHPAASLSDMLTWIHENAFPAEKVTTVIADFDDAPLAYEQRATKCVLYRPPLT
ncbi:alcohol dehydrogenase catalytic domain-containing protein [Nocardia yamanashiensis]|uniref:alcohol dehydrogenase catalytic domain-containing protein n=1 Tax=Nocardia yamanashiensis TaxID=209247 RepID=UPI001E2C0BEF|nr:alcohol dehydrogenase catalytic domain-containing protein [Nocardia yamanashiensis]UGT43995.1 alcohol dehydrogenase catalytic domain-containing protein [Nocardia yamanashiensis]